jgi:hypothetical protein
MIDLLRLTMSNFPCTTLPEELSNYTYYNRDTLTFVKQNVGME